MESDSEIQKSDSEMSVSIRTPMEKKNHESEVSEASSVSDLEISGNFLFSAKDRKNRRFFSGVGRSVVS